METIQNQTAKALTALSEPQTKAKPKITGASNLLAWEQWLKFKTFNDPELIAVVGACENFALNFKDGNSPRWISILGETGTGKSHCARRLWNHLSARLDWRAAIFIQREIYWPKFVCELRAGEAYDKLRDMMTWPVLFLDDVAAERDTTGFASEQLNTLLGCRADKWTIITSNKNLEQIGGIDPRIADRMIRSPNIFVEVNTQSFSLRETRLPYAD